MKTLDAPNVFQHLVNCMTISYQQRFPETPELRAERTVRLALLDGIPDMYVDALRISVPELKQVMTHMPRILQLLGIPRKSIARDISAIEQMLASLPDDTPVINRVEQRIRVLGLITRHELTSYLQQLLPEEEYQLRFSHSGRESLKLLGRHPWDILLVGGHFSDTSIVEIVQKIQELGNLVPLIMLSGAEEMSMSHYYLSLGVDRVIGYYESGLEGLPHAIKLARKQKGLGQRILRVEEVNIQHRNELMLLSDEVRHLKLENDRLQVKRDRQQQELQQIEAFMNQVLLPELTEQTSNRSWLKSGHLPADNQIRLDATVHLLKDALHLIPSTPDTGEWHWETLNEHLDHCSLHWTSLPRDAEPMPAQPDLFQKAFALVLKMSGSREDAPLTAALSSSGDETGEPALQLTIDLPGDQAVSHPDIWESIFRFLFRSVQAEPTLHHRSLILRFPRTAPSLESRPRFIDS